MKKTQIVHSPRTFKLGLGLIIAAGLASMPVLTEAGERSDAKAKTSTTSKEEGASKKTASKTEKKRTGSTKKSASKARTPSAEDRARDRLAKLQLEAKKIASTLTPTQKTKLLALLNDAEPEQLTEIEGIGKSRSSAIEEARPIESIEDLSKVSGVGIKTFTEVVDHGKTLTRSRSSSSKAKTKAPASSSKKSTSSRSTTKKKA